MDVVGAVYDIAGLTVDNPRISPEGHDLINKIIVGPIKEYLTRHKPGPIPLAGGTSREQTIPEFLKEIAFVVPVQHAKIVTTFIEACDHDVKLAKQDNATGNYIFYGKPRVVKKVHESNNAPVDINNPNEFPGLPTASAPVVVKNTTIVHETPVITKKVEEVVKKPIDPKIGFRFFHLPHGITTRNVIRPKRETNVPTIPVEKMSTDFYSDEPVTKKYKKVVDTIEPIVNNNKFAALFEQDL